MATLKVICVTHEGIVDIQHYNVLHADTLFRSLMKSASSMSRRRRSMGRASDMVFLSFIWHHRLLITQKITRSCHAYSKLSKAKKIEWVADNTLVLQLPLFEVHGGR
ncbi:hypothetical protein GOP47_0017982 [Adiantum capillus-veneris]|uniref:Uncharacterized protein n=1 Tax=Adiantum capillus-veneris TaxID=13818 RepID=A0A9D4UHE0_ADICA|nr:hypothetical protein GOP47_0017982 [Adiantum capillus-veneris]